MGLLCLLWLLLLFPRDTSTVCLGTIPAWAAARSAAAQADDAQLGAHTPHAPLPTLHAPADDVTPQGADTRVSKLAAPQSQVSPHTGRPSCCQRNYCPRCSLIIASIFVFTASRLNVAGSCIGG